MKKKHHAFWIIGAGECGKRAAKKLRKKYPEAPLTVVDQDQGALDGLEGLPIACICMEGASYLETHLDGDARERPGTGGICARPRRRAGALHGPW